MVQFSSHINMLPSLSSISSLIPPQKTVQICANPVTQHGWGSMGTCPSMAALLMHSVTCHPAQVNTPCLNTSKTGWYSIYLPQRDGRLSWFGTEMLYLPVDSHPSK